MKKYEVPTVEVVTFDVEDIVTASTDNWQEGSAGDDD